MKTKDADEIDRLRNALAFSIEQVRGLAAERDALRARIDEAPVAPVLEGMSGALIGATGGLPREWIGKRVRLVVEDEK